MYVYNGRKKTQCLCGHRHSIGMVQKVHVIVFKYVLLSHTVFKKYSYFSRLKKEKKPGPCLFVGCVNTLCSTTLTNDGWAEDEMRNICRSTKKRTPWWRVHDWYIRACAILQLFSCISRFPRKIKSIWHTSIRLRNIILQPTLFSKSHKRCKWMTVSTLENSSIVITNYAIFI